MVWGCISYHGVGKLQMIEATMDKVMYMDILKKNLKQSAEVMGISEVFHFYQDNDPKHKSRLVQEWLLYNCPKIMQTPPQSPDLNPIEMVWNMLDTKIRRHSITNKKDLQSRLQEEWLKMDNNYLKTLVGSMPKRLAEVIRQKGYATKY
ncbi:Transposable element Tcb2 transposase [Anthophora quadrimaculata]